MPEPEALHRPATAGEIFRVFNGLALQGFGGVLAVAQRELVERQRWMNRAQFLDLLAISGAITTAPDMQRYVVGEKGWLSDVMFTTSVAIAQAAPGPNVLFVAVVGWNVAGLAGVFATLMGSLLPSTTLALSATRWGDKRKDSRGMRAFTAGLAPLTLGLLLATGWILTEPVRDHVGAMLLVPLTVLGMLKTRVSPVWWVAAGAVAGALGLAGQQGGGASTPSQSSGPK